MCFVPSILTAAHSACAQAGAGGLVRAAAAGRLPARVPGGAGGMGGGVATVGGTWQMTGVW